MKVLRVVDKDKAIEINPFYRGDEFTPSYISPGDRVSVEVESREMEVAIIKAYDYGIDSLNPDGRKLIQRFIDDALLRMKGKI